MDRACVRRRCAARLLRWRLGAVRERLQQQSVFPLLVARQFLYLYGEVVVRNTRTVLNYNEVDGCRGRYLTVNPPMPCTPNTSSESS